MEINRSNINEIVTKASLRPDKDYGQNFLVEPSICERIVDALNLDEKDYVLEVGPGLGSLTHFVSLKNPKYDAVDIDPRMVNFLRVVYQENTNIQIIESDIRKHDVSKYNKVIGNLPYNITTETIQFFLTNATSAKRMVFMIQSEALNRFYDYCYIYLEALKNYSQLKRDHSIQRLNVVQWCSLLTLMKQKIENPLLERSS